MWENDIFDGLSGDKRERSSDYSTDIWYESDCCGYARERDIYDAIAEFELSEVWD